MHVTQINMEEGGEVGGGAEYASVLAGKTNVRVWLRRRDVNGLDAAALNLWIQSYQMTLQL